MTTPTPGQGINLSALWLPVLPETSQLAPEMRKAGQDAKTAFEQGFNEGKTPEQVTRDYMGHMREAMTKGFNELEIPFGISKVSEWLEQFRGEVDEKLVGTLKGEATQALQAFGAEQEKLIPIQERAAEAERRLNLARENGFNQASIMLPLIAEQTAAHEALEAQTKKTSEAHDQLTTVTGKLSEEQGKAANSGEFMAGVMGGLVVVGAGLAFKAVEEFVDFIKEGFEEGIEITKELAEQTLELGEKYEEIGLGVREFSSATGEAFEDLESRSRKVFGSLDVAGEDTGKTFAQLTSVLGDAIPDSLVRHVEELKGRFSDLKAQDIASIMLAFKVPAEETDNVLASLTMSARGAGHDIGELASLLKGNAAEALHEAGMNAQQAGAFVADMMKLDAGGHSMLSGLQTVMKEAAKEGISFGDGIKYAGERLKELGDTQAGQEYAEKLFGTRRWAVAMQAAQDYVDVVSQAPTAFDSNSAALDQFVQDTQTLENKWEEVKHKIEEAFMPLGLSSLDLVDNLIEGIKKKFDENLPEIKGKVKEIGESFIDNLPAIGNFVSGAIEMIGPLADFLKMVGTMFTGFFVGAGEIWGALTGNTDLVDKMNHMNDDLKKFSDFDFTGLASKASNMVQSFVPKNDEINTLKQQFDKLFDSARGEGDDQKSPGAPLPDLTPQVGPLAPSAGSPGGFTVPPGVGGTPAPSSSGNPLTAPFGDPNSGIFQGPDGRWHARDPWWEGVMQAESGGNIAPTSNPTHFGLFQFAQSTWDSVARQVNPAWVGKNPGTAPADVQAQIAQQNYDQNKGNLYGQWANPYVQAHPGGTPGSIWSPTPGGNNGNGPGDAPDPNAAVANVGGLNLSTVAVAAQKFANDCIDASARIILSHSGVNMSEDDLEKVITPGGTISSLATGLNELDPQGNYQALQGSGGSQQAMFAAIKASIDNGTGSILNVAPGSALAGRTFAPGHFIAATGYNGDGTINVSDTAGGRQYSVTAADAFQATEGRGIVAGAGTGPQAQAGMPSPLAAAGNVGPGGYPGLPGQYGGYGQYGGENADQVYSTAHAAQEARDHADDLDDQIKKQQRTIDDLKAELAKGDPKNQPGLLGASAETDDEKQAYADKQKHLNEQLDDANTELKRIIRERGEQDGAIAEADRKQQEAMYKKPKGSGQSAEGKAGETLGQGLLAGIGQELGIGDVLGKSPLDWGIVKLAEGLFNYGNDLGDAVFGKSGGFGNPGGTEGLGAGLAKGVLGSLNIKTPNAGGSNVVKPPPMPPPGVHTGTGVPQPAGPAIVNNDNSITIQAGVDDKTVLGPVQEQQNSSNSSAFQYQSGFPQ